MGLMSSIVNFIKCRFMMTVITVTTADGGELTGKVVYACENLVGLDTGKCTIYINADQIVTFTQKY